MALASLIAASLVSLLGCALAVILAARRPRRRQDRVLVGARWLACASAVGWAGWGLGAASAGGPMAWAGVLLATAAVTAARVEYRGGREG